ncbi:MAG: hypothetical protein ABI779_03080 [Acidobacteriota bacterium]
MWTRLALAFSLLLSLAAFAQVDPLSNLSGTSPAVGASPWIRSGSGSLTFFHGFDIHATHLSQTGPEEQENATFSTNWFGAGAQLALGERAFVLGRGRISLEPYTIDDSYPQFFQYVPEDGLVDHMRPHDLFGEVAVQVGFRPTNATLLSVYGALVGQPALGAAPAQLRASGIDFAEAPFTYELLETTHDSTSVVTAGFASRFFTIEASMFHDGATTGDHTELDSGDMDSRSARLTIMPAPNLAIQVSRGELGVEGDLPLALQSDLTTASLTYGGPVASVTALWSSRSFPEDDARETVTGYAVELALRASRNTFMARVEQIDRPGGFPLAPRPAQDVEGATHYTAGYVFDIMPASRYKLGLGVNIDYRTKTRELEDVYGHKPQGIYTFVRLRS